MFNRTNNRQAVRVINRSPVRTGMEVTGQLQRAIGQLAARSADLLSDGQYPSHYHQPSSARLSHLGLDTRDIDILVTAADCHLITTHQLQRIHFNTDKTYKSELYAANACRSALKRLAHQNMLNRERRVGGARRGSSMFIYSLGEGGAQLLSHADRALHAYIYDPVDNHNDHTLEIAEFYTKLREAHHKREITILDLQTDPLTQRIFGNASQVLYPDMLLTTVRFSDPDPLYSWFIEWDRDTEHKDKVEQKLLQYVRYCKSGIEQETRGLFPTVLWVVPSYKRKLEIEKYIKGVVADIYQRLFRVELEVPALELIRNPLQQVYSPPKLAA